MRAQNDLDHQIEMLATRQYGVVARRQLLAMGIGAKAITYRVGLRRLVVRHPGVYTVGHRVLTREGRWLAAVLACGEGAALSHFDAAAHLDLLANRGARIHVTRPTNAGRAPDPRRIALHRVGTLQAEETTIHDGIPTTTTARTLLDLAHDLSPTALEDVIQHGIRLHRFDLLAVRRCLDRHPRQPGAPKLRQLLQELTQRGVAHTRSDLERRFLALCDGLPERPAVNARVAGLEVDFLWPSARLVVETDGYAFHSSRHAFERDRERDQRLTLNGYTVVRVTHRQLAEQPEAVVDRLRQLLEQRV